MKKLNKKEQKCIIGGNEAMGPEPCGYIQWHAEAGVPVGAYIYTGYCTSQPPPWGNYAYLIIEATTNCPPFTPTTYCSFESAASAGIALS